MRKILKHRIRIGISDLITIDFSPNRDEIADPGVGAPNKMKQTPVGFVFILRLSLGKQSFPRLGAK